VKIVAVIPARYDSTRFAGKVLAKDTGKFLIQHAYERACQAKLPQKVIIAADDEKVAAAARTFGAECVLTSPAHQSGTDRIAEAVADMDVEIVVNLQADEPEIDPANIDHLAKLLLDNPDYPMATLVAPFQRAEQVADPNIVKVIVSPCVVRDASCVKKQVDSRFRGNDREKKCSPIVIPAQAGIQNGVEDMDSRFHGNDNTQNEIGRAIYFSRSVIPYDRQEAGIGDVRQYLRHIGIYAYRKRFLLKITALPQTPLEKIEKLEQLRAIENGFGILVGKVEHTCDGIDTPEQYTEFVKRCKKNQRVCGPEENFQ
jgi:3-deoxy-manno-octulosonate cytidylyltransferase (CMP-KDO synthetase)